MMTKRIIFLVMVVMLACTYFAANSYAAEACYNATVINVGPNSGYVYAQLTSAQFPSPTTRWFQARTNQQNQILAVALTAITSEMSVLACMDLAVGTYPAITAMYISNE